LSAAPDNAAIQTVATLDLITKNHEQLGKLRDLVNSKFPNYKLSTRLPARRS
jgi:hypothetical protein